MSGSSGERALHAYHDGELRGFARWRFQRRVARSPELRRELEALALMRELVREGESRVPTPDLWEGISRRLPPAEGARPARIRDREAREGRGAPAPLVWLARPLGAAAAVAVVAVALVFALNSGDNAAPGVVRWIDSGDRNVMVLEGDEEVTIIWVLGDASTPPRQGGAGEGA
jgi:anti-sigma factor RsiW